MTTSESRSLLRGGVFLLVLSLLRVTGDLVRTNDPPIREDPGNLDQLLEESREIRDGEERRSAPLGPGETLDPNRAGEEELDRLPGVGPALARTLVEDRIERGAFPRAEDLLRVRGVGPATLEKIRPYLDFSRGVPAELRDRRSRVEGTGAREGFRSNPTDGGPIRELNPVRILVDLNHAGALELQALPGIGPVLADRIVGNRDSLGPFRRPEELQRVPGIGPSTLARILQLVRAGR